MLRAARAANPHDEDINTRYLALKDALTRHVRIVPRCDAALRDQCLELGHAVLRDVTGANREFIVLVPERAAKHNTDLEIQLEMTGRDTGWKLTQQGGAVRAMKRYDDTKEVVLGKDGKPALAEVKARYSVHRRTTAVSVRVSMDLVALEGGRVSLWSDALGGKQTDTATYYDWSGDHRALQTSKTAWVLSVGTNRTPPAEPLSMARALWTDATRRLSSGMITALEAAP